jgi:Putative zinc-finger
MNKSTRNEETTVHQEISLLLPWYVNASLDDQDRLKVDSHLAECAICRDDLRLEQRVYQGVADDAGIEYMPAVSLKKLQSKLDGTKPEAEEVMAPGAAPGAVPRAGFKRRSLPWQGLMAASIAVLAVAVSLLAADRWMHARIRGAAPEFYTVTNPVVRPQDEVIRAVFAPNITLVELQGVLDEAQLRIVAGPTEAGVYSLARKSDVPVSSSLARLRAHSTVRFAESTQPVGESGQTP